MTWIEETRTFLPWWVVWGPVVVRLPLVFRHIFHCCLAGGDDRWLAIAPGGRSIVGGTCQAGLSGPKGRKCSHLLVRCDPTITSEFT